MSKQKIHVSSEIGRLRRLMIHSPDGGIGKILPSKFREWLYDDTVHLEKMRLEYDEYVKILLYFLDPGMIDKIKAHEAKAEDESARRTIMRPDHPDYFNSDKVLDAQKVLSEIIYKMSKLDNKRLSAIRVRLISAVCAIENCSFETEERLNELSDEDLAQVLITGVWPKEDDQADEVFIFPPIPNFVFTRDIGIVVNGHLLLSRFAKQARKREALLARFIALHKLFAEAPELVIEVAETADFCLMDDDEKIDNMVTYEGGDIMMISPTHILIGCSERTSPTACNALVHKLFSKPKTGIETVSVIKIPPVRAQMHIDTIFTQVKRNVWVLYGPYSELLQKQQKEGVIDYVNDLRYDKEVQKEVEVIQFNKPIKEKYDPNTDYRVENGPKGLAELLIAVSTEEFGCRKKDVKFIYSAAGVFPYDQIEQWTDSCNLLAVKEGVVIGYDRNDRTIEQFEREGFRAITANALMKEFEAGTLDPESLTDTLILLSSTELSRGRGGSHCMSMPLLRDEVKI